MSNQNDDNTGCMSGVLIVVLLTGFFLWFDGFQFIKELISDPQTALAIGASGNFENKAALFGLILVCMWLGLIALLLGLAARQQTECKWGDRHPVALKTAVSLSCFLAIALSISMFLILVYYADIIGESIFPASNNLVWKSSRNPITLVEQHGWRLIVMYVVSLGFAIITVLPAIDAVKDITAIKNEKQIRIVKENINNTDKLKEIVLSQNYTDEMRESALNHIHIRYREQIKDMIDNGNLPENIKIKVKARYEYFVQCARKNRELDIKIMNENDVRELVKKTESPEELKIIIKVRESTSSSNIDAQKKLRIVLEYSSDEYYCPKCNETVKSEERNMRTSDTGRTYYDIKCSQCGYKLDEGMSYAAWYEPETN